MHSASRGLGSETPVRQCDGGGMQNVSSCCVSLPHTMESQTIISEREVRYLMNVESIQGLSRRERWGLGEGAYAAVRTTPETGTKLTL